MIRFNGLTGHEQRRFLAEWRTPEQQKARRPREPAMWHATFSADGRTMVSSQREWIYVWDAASGTLRRKFRHPHQHGCNVMLAPDGRTLATSDVRNAGDPGDDTIRLFDIETGEQVLTLDPGDGRASVMAFSPDGKRLFTGFGRGSGIVWNMLPEQRGIDVKEMNERGGPPVWREQVLRAFGRHGYHHDHSCSDNPPRASAGPPALPMGDSDVPVLPHHRFPGPIPLRRSRGPRLRRWRSWPPSRSSRDVLARDGATGDNARPVDFATQVRPLFARTCLKCHGPEKQRGGLRLDSRASVLKGGDSGEPAIVPGDPDASALLERVASDDSTVRMPPKGERLAAGESGLLKRWVAEGAAWPETGASARPGRAEMIVTDADRDHWAFRPLRPVPPPERSSDDRARTPIDRFLLVAQEAKG